MLVVLAAAAMMGWSQEPPEPYRAWIRDLGHEDPSARDAAAAHLRAAGRAAWPALEETARSADDPEVRARARDLLDASRLRRRLSHRILEEHPTALAALTAGATTEKIRLIRTLGRHFEECSDLLLAFVRDPEPEIAVAAAEALYENRNYEWGPDLLELYARENCPRSGRIYELISSAATRLPALPLERAYAEAGPRGRLRLMTLASNANLPLSIPPSLLREMLRYGDAPARRAALAWMRDRGAQGNLLEIESLLADPDAPVVTDALMTLRYLRHRPDPERIEALLEHEEPSVREEAVHVIVAFEERVCAAALRRRLEDSSTAVRLAALGGLARLEGAAALEDVLRVFFRDSGESREQAAGILNRNRDWAMPRLQKALAEGDADRRLRALDLLKRADPSIPFARVRDESEAVRRWALAEALKVESPAAVQALEALTGDPAETIRFEALKKLVRLGRRERVGDLRPFLGSAEYTIRYDAAESILEHGGDQAEALARELVGDPDAPLRRLALNALADREGRDCIEPALAYLKDPDGRLRRSAAQYLGKKLAQKREPALVARLAAMLESAEEEPLSLSFNLVVSYGDRSCADPVRRLVASGRAPSPARAVQALADWAGGEALADLVPLLGSDATVNGLIFTRAKELLPRAAAARAALEDRIRGLLSHPDRRVRRAAVCAAEDLGVAADAVLARIGDPDPSVVCAAIDACSRLGLAAAAPALQGRLDDEDPDVRIVAAISLVKLKPEARAAVERRVTQEDCAWARARIENALKLVRR